MDGTSTNVKISDTNLSEEGGKSKIFSDIKAAFEQVFDPEKIKLEELPQRVKDAIKEIQEAESIEEKAAIAQKFSNSYMKYQEQYDMSLEGIVPFEELVNNSIGDCDDFAKVNAGLLVLGGVDPEDVTIVSSIINYHEIGDDPANDVRGGHFFVAVSDENDDFLMVDNNLDRPIPFDLDQPFMIGHFNKNDPNNIVDADIEVTVPSIHALLGGDGTFYADPEAVVKDLEHSRFSYTIQSGDNLSGISKRIYGNGSPKVYNALAEENNIEDPNKIYAGDTLSIPFTLGN